MIKINFEKCTGCGACVQVCPKNCISWGEEELGFLYPDVDEIECIDCGLCEKVCPIEKKTRELVNQKAYAAVHKNNEVLFASTSGGAFTAIANTILEADGIVYGAFMDKNMKVFHKRIEDINELSELRGSKYLQSDIKETYQQAEKDLKNGKLVLYTGTPCQIDGLKSFLNNNYENLYSIDIICHGVGSQKYFDKYLEYAKTRWGEIKELKFRSKEYVGWSCGGGEVVVGTENMKKNPFYDYDNYYYSYFLSGDIYRQSCYKCKYANIDRVGDFTLGDYWGVEALKLDLKTENGCSLLLVNNSHAMNLFKRVTELKFLETTIEQAAHCNKQLNEPSKFPAYRDKRIVEYETLSGIEIQKEYLKFHKKYVIKGKLKSMIPYKLRLYIRKKRK